MNQTAQILKSYGLKVTPQRIAIYEMLCNTTKHPNADTIYKTLEPTNPTMSLATVYKTLDYFKSLGIIQELNVGEGRARYDAIPYSHPHIVCTQCNTVEDFCFNDFQNLREKVAEKTDYQIEREQLIFYGICPKCREKNTL